MSNLIEARAVIKNNITGDTEKFEFILRSGDLFDEDKMVGCRQEISGMCGSMEYALHEAMKSVAATKEY